MNNRSATFNGGESFVIRFVVTGLLFCVLLWAATPTESVHKAFEPSVAGVSGVDTGGHDNLDSPADLLASLIALSTTVAVGPISDPGTSAACLPSAFITPPTRASPALV